MKSYKSNTLNNYFILIAIISLTVLSTYITNYFLINEDLIYNSLSEKLADEQIRVLIDKSKGWDWIQYAIIPIVILLRTSLVAFSLSIGNFFYNMENKTSFKKIFRISLLGELVLVLVGYFKLAYFYFIKTNYNLEELQRFHPLSYTSFLDLDKIQPWLIYPLQTINLFEIAYFFVLVFGMYKLLNNKYWKSFEITAVSYGSGLVIWMGLVMFLTLNIS